MSSQSNPPEKTLEMRVAAIEDKLAQASVTPEEMRAFQKVASLATAAAPAFSQFCFNCVVTVSVPVSTGVTVGHHCAIAVQQSQPQGGGQGFGGLGR